MKTCTENGDGTNTYECAVPWAFLDQWGYGQVAVGYAWGMSLVVINGYDDGDSLTSPFMSYLTWGSGICAAQQDYDYLRPTIGGSNAIILSDRDAITGEVVPNLPQIKEPSDDGEVVHNIIDANGLTAYYLPSSASAVDGDFDISWDVAYLGDDPINPDRTWVGALLGEDYGMAAGWDAETNRFFVAENNWHDGINKDISYVVSEEEFDWPVGEWHRLGIKVVDETVTITFDGDVVLEDTDTRNECVAYGDDYEMIIYNIGDYVYDNYKIVTGGETIADYTCDSDDEDFNRSDFKLNALPMYHEFIEGKCKIVDPESRYGCLFNKATNTEGVSVLRCDFCGTEEIDYSEIMLGDANSDGKVDTKDVFLTLQYIAKIENITVYEYAADVNGDGSINLSDVSLMLKAIIGWVDCELPGVTEGMGSYSNEIPTDEIRNGFYFETISAEDDSVVAVLHFKNKDAFDISAYSLNLELDDGLELVEEPWVEVNKVTWYFSENITDDPYRMLFVSHPNPEYAPYGEDTAIATMEFKVTDPDNASVRLSLDLNNPPIDRDLNEISLDLFGLNSEITLPCRHLNLSSEYVDATCTEDGYVIKACIDCGVEVSREDTTPATGHVDTTVINHSDPTCTTNGYTGDLYCLDCETIIESGELVPGGHSIVQYAAKAPNCTEIGWFAYEACENCDYTTYAELREYGHRIVSHEGKAPTGTEIGWEAYESCTECDYTTYVEIPTTGILSGDVNDDGSINLSDASLVLMHIAKWDITLNEEAADVTHDGSVNLSDVSLLLRYIANWDGITL